MPFRARKSVEINFAPFKYTSWKKNIQFSKQMQMNTKVNCSLFKTQILKICSKI